MITLTNSGGVAMTNCFLIADEAARVAVLFDAPDHTVDPLLDETAKRGWDLIGLWLTHGHFDHFADHARVRQRFPNVKVLIHGLDQAKVGNPSVQTRIFQLPFVIPPLTPDANVVDGQVLRIGSLEVKVLHTPGHSPGHVGYLLQGENVLVGGDLIIGGSVGRTDLPDSNHPELEKSVRRVMQLPDSTTLLSGHGPTTTLGQERKRNMYVRQILQGD
jgi:glyoxylase-like metal-dependent hydrolase (beta-lactamase superfamily II)